MKKIVNMTQHMATQEQKDAGVIEPKKDDKERIGQLLTFNEIPTYDEMILRASELVSIATNYDAMYIMIGGAPFFMSILEKILIAHYFNVLYAFSKRESIEENEIKKSVFKHLGFYFVKNFGIKE